MRQRETESDIQDISINITYMLIERETDRQKDIHTDRQTDRQTETERQTEADRQTQTNK